MTTLSLLSVSWKELPREEQLGSIAIVAGVLLTTLHRQACGVDVLPATGLLESNTARAWTYHAATFILFAALPALLIRLVWKAPLSDFGVAVGDWKFGLTTIAILLPLISILFLLPASQMDDMRSVYPVDKSAGDSLLRFIAHASGRVFLFYLGWEFLFRGFLLFGLRQTTGDAIAICIQTLPSALWHINYPAGELYMSIAAGILFGWLALRTRSILWPLLLHAGIGIVTDLSITLSM